MGRKSKYDTRNEAKEAKKAQNRKSYQTVKAQDPEKFKEQKSIKNKADYEKRKAREQIFKEFQMKAACEIAEEL